MESTDESLGNAFAVKAWVGPVWVKQWAEKLRSQGFVSVSEGTEHVYVVSRGSDKLAAAWNATVDFERANGTASGIHFRAV